MVYTHSGRVRFINGGVGGRGALTYLKVVGNFLGIEPLFDFFKSKWVHFYAKTRSYWPPFSAVKIGLSVSQLVPEIIWPKVDQMFEQNLLFDNFKAFCTTFFLNFRSCWPLLLLFLNLFNPLFFQNLLSLFFLHALDLS